ncbi:MASE3 domain-containing protein [Anaerobacillus sp. MEB173]|uniref:MASE3 domain-containing protein n=1 Tax=Anaerobacillus sp. MEB173 TaxID=3383345 RepID=UPI003F8F8F39
MEHTKNNIHTFLKQNGFLIVIPLLTVLTAIVFSDLLYSIIKDDNYVVTHLILEFFIIIVSATIALQAWMIFPHTLSNHRLWLGGLFSTITFIEIFHAILPIKGCHSSLWIAHRIMRLGFICQID